MILLDKTIVYVAADRVEAMRTRPEINGELPVIWVQWGDKRTAVREAQVEGPSELIGDWTPSSYIEGKPEIFRVWLETFGEVAVGDPEEILNTVEVVP